MVNKDKEAFFKDPSLFIRTLLVAKNEVVNGLVIGSRVLERLKSKLNTSSEPITPLVILTFHVEKGEGTSFRFTYDTTTGAVGTVREKAVPSAAGAEHIDKGHTSSAEIEKLGEGTFGLERLTLSVVDEEKESFSRDPELFIRNALVSKGEKVNGLTIDAEDIEGMKRRFDSGGVPVVPLVILFVHVEAPAQYASNHCKYDTERGEIVR